jgi:glycosyltransferase involved in cell wall biosynthesis
MQSTSVVDSGRPELCVVVPVFNEEEVLGEFHRRLSAVLHGLGIRYEVIYVNDGSSDNTLALLEELHATDPHCSTINLSRNFGKEVAVTAGFDHALGECVVVMDGDLQDPPELIPELIDRWRDGFDVVYAKRRRRDGETFLKKLTASLFYRTIRRLTNVDIPSDTGDFRLLSQRAVMALGTVRERHRFMKGLFAWIGFPSTAVLYDRDARFAGETKWNYWKLWNLALEGITSFTTAPLRIASYLGLLTAGAAFIYAIWVVYKTLRFGDSVAGYPSLMVVLLFLGGVQLITLGVIGEYLGRMFMEGKQRPLYLVEGHHRGARFELVRQTGEEKEGS